MERLTDKNWRNLDPWECCGQAEYCKRTCHSKGGCANGCIVPKLYAKLAQYEDLEEQGRLVKLPCKYLDEVFFADVFNGLQQGHAVYFECQKAESVFVSTTAGYCLTESFGKTVFLTKAEAEAKLKEMRGGENGR